MWCRTTERCGSPVAARTNLSRVHRERKRGFARRFVLVTDGVFTPGVRDYPAGVDNPRLVKPFKASKLKKVVNDFVRQAQGERLEE